MRVTVTSPAASSLLSLTVGMLTVAEPASSASDTILPAPSAPLVRKLPFWVTV